MAFNYANVLNNIAQAIQQPRQSQQASQPQQSSGSKQGAGGSFADLLKQASASQQPQQQEAAPVYYEQPSRSSGSNKINTTSNEKEDSKKKESNETDESTPFRRGRSSIFMPEQAFAVGENAATSEGGKAGENIPDNYIADPNAIAMPTGEEMEQLSPAERDQWQNTTGFLAALTGGAAAVPATAGMLGTGATILPALGIGTAGVLSANKQNVDKKTAEEKENDRQFTSEYQPSNLTQMQEYYNWLDTDDGRAFLERYGDEFGADNQGYTNLRASQNRDAWADVMGFGEGDGIGNWQNRYTNSGVDLSDEHAMDNLMEYLYGDQAANLYDWVGNNDYNQSRVGISGDAYDEAALWFANQNPELMQAYNQEYAGGNDTFNADDFAYYALLTRLTNPEYGFNDVSIDELNRAAQAAGEGNTFGLTEQGLLGLMNDEGTSEESDRNNARRYLMNDNTVLNPWLQGDNPLMDQQMIDSVLAAYNAPKQQGSKESK